MGKPNLKPLCNACTNSTSYPCNKGRRRSICTGVGSSGPGRGALRTGSRWGSKITAISWMWQVKLVTCMFILAAMTFQTLRDEGFPCRVLGLEFPKLWALIQSSQCVEPHGISNGASNENLLVYMPTKIWNAVVQVSTFEIGRDFEIKSTLAVQKFPRKFKLRETRESSWILCKLHKILQKIQEWQTLRTQSTYAYASYLITNFLLIN